MDIIPTKLRVFLQMQRSILFRYGWLKALMTGRPVDNDGEPLPWITYPAIDFLKQFDFTKARVFEWGSGFSTLWWAKRCHSITTVETNSNWVPYIQPMLPANVTLLTPPFEIEAEAQTINHLDHLFEVIVIDNNGPFRWRCAETATSRLADGGFIMLDNSDQCLRTTAILRNSGFCQIDFTGLCPGGGYVHCTSLFFKKHIGIPLLTGEAPLQSVAQPNPPWENC